MKKLFLAMALCISTAVFSVEKWRDKKGRKFVVEGSPSALMENHSFFIYHMEKGPHRLVATENRDEYYVNHKQLRGATVIKIIEKLQKGRRRFRRKYIFAYANKKKQ